MVEITDVKDLQEALSSNYILLIGSAISGCGEPFLPMVSTFIIKLVEESINIIQDSKYADKLIFTFKKNINEYKKKKYSKIFKVRTKRFIKILQTTKFEDFLWRVQNAFKSEKQNDKLNELLKLIYKCKKNEFGFNHSAISFLLKQQHCKLCFTTNFDNTIELSYKQLTSHDINIYDYNDYQSKISQYRKPSLIKLHGDAEKKTCIATMPIMISGYKEDKFKKLENILKNQKVFAIGYSGYGDIDISPHLAKLANKNICTFIWTDYKKNSIPKYTQKYVITDLSKRNNMLTLLAEINGWKNNYNNYKKHNWEELLIRWCKKIDPLIHKKIIKNILNEQASWRLLHLWYLTKEFKRDQIESVKVFEQVGAYKSAIRICDENLNPKTQNKWIWFLCRKGFCQWRMGNINDALLTLEKLHTIYNTNLNNDDLKYIAEGFRYYLEITRNWMLINTNITLRKKFYNTKRIMDIFKILKKLPEPDPKQIVIIPLSKLNILYMIEKIDKEDFLTKLNHIYDQALYSQQWQYASQVARVIMNCSLGKGIVRLLKVDWKLIIRGNYNLIRKSLASFIFSLFGCKFPIILDVLDGRFFAKIRTPISEVSCKLLFWYWNLKKK